MLMQKAIWMISTTHMFIEAFYFTQAALIPVMIQEFHLSILEASLVTTVPNLVLLLMYIPSGLLADRFSVNHLLFASMAIEGISILMVSQAMNYWVLILALCFMRIASPMYHTSGLSQITRIAKPDQLNMTMGLHNALGDLGTAAGVSSLAVFLSILNWRWTYAFWAVPILIWGIVVLTSAQLKNTRPKRTHVQSAERLRNLSTILFSVFLIFVVVVGVRELGSTVVSTFMTTYLVKSIRVTESTASLIFGLAAFVGIPGSLAGGYLGKKIGARNALSLAIFASVISLSLLACVSQVYLLTPVYLVYAFFDYVAWSPMHAMVGEITPEETRGLSYSIYFFAYSLIFSLAPVLAAGVIQLSDIWIVFPFSIVSLAASVIILQLLHPSRAKPVSRVVGGFPRESYSRLAVNVRPRKVGSIRICAVLVQSNCTPR
jgi:FSR family fosmidomycin resistance protein-like MFS transporter